MDNKNITIIALSATVLYLLWQKNKQLPTNTGVKTDLSPNAMIYQKDKLCTDCYTATVNSSTPIEVDFFKNEKSGGLYHGKLDFWADIDYFKNVSPRKVGALPFTI